MTLLQEGCFELKELLNWPRMDQSLAIQRFSEVTEMTGPEVLWKLEEMSFSPIGARVQEKDVRDLRDAVIDIANSYGFHRRRGFDQEDPGERARSSFDREVFRSLRIVAPMRWSEAGSREVWSWFALGLLPDVTHWRWKFGKGPGWNKERWIGSDLTRHTWARQWWRSVQLEGAEDLVNDLMESEYNQLTERADTIGSNPALVAAHARANIQAHSSSGVQRRALIRDSSQRLLRDMAYIEDSIVDVKAAEDWTNRLVAESVRNFNL